MRRMSTPPKRGRPPAAGVARDQWIRVRATPEEVAALKAVGVERFRRWLQAAYKRMKEGKTPPA